MWTGRNTGNNLLLVTTPSSLMMLGLLNCPMIEASRRKSRLCCSVQPPLRVFIATMMSILPGPRSRPRHTSPYSPGRGGGGGGGSDVN